MKISFNELEKMISDGKFVDVNKIDMIYYERDKYDLYFEKDIRDTTELIEIIEADIFMLKDIKIEIGELADFIKDPNKMIYDFYFNKMKQKDTELVNVDLFVKMYGFIKPEIKPYNKNLINNILIKDDKMVVDIEKLKKQYNRTLKTEDKQRIINMIYFIYSLNGNYNIGDIRHIRNTWDVNKDTHLRSLFLEKI